MKLTQVGRLFVVLITNISPSLQITSSGKTPCEICVNGGKKYDTALISKIMKRELEMIKNKRTDEHIKYMHWIILKIFV